MALDDFLANQNVTRARWARLRAFYDHAGVVPGPQFSCCFFDACNSAFTLKNNSEIPEAGRGCAAYLGPRYDLTERSSGVGVRVAVVGIDQGEEASTIEDRRAGILAMTPKTLNTHMRGVSKILQVFFGEQSRNLNVFEYYAMPNALKCSDLRRSWRRPAEMSQRCSDYLLSELRILEPNVIFTQSHPFSFEPLRARLETEYGTLRMMKQHEYADWYLAKFQSVSGDLIECNIIDSPHPRNPKCFYRFFFPYFRDHLVHEVRVQLGLEGQSAI
jgi:hypothetical protein